MPRYPSGDYGPPQERDDEPEPEPGPSNETRLYLALQALVMAWDAVEKRSRRENLQVPDEINDDDLWDEARAALRQAEGVPDLFGDTP